MEEARNDSSMASGESQEQKTEVILEAHRNKTKVHFATLMIDICHLKKRGVGNKIAELQRQSRASRRHCKRWFRLLCSIHRARFICVTNDCLESNGCYCKITRLRRTSAADAVSAYIQVKLEDAPRLFEIPELECPDLWIRLPRHKMA